MVLLAKFGFGTRFGAWSVESAEQVRCAFSYARSFILSSYFDYVDSNQDTMSFGYCAICLETSERSSTDGECPNHALIQVLLIHLRYLNQGRSSEASSEP